MKKRPSDMHAASVTQAVTIDSIPIRCAMDSPKNFNDLPTRAPCHVVREEQIEYGFMPAAKATLASAT